MKKTLFLSIALMVGLCAGLAQAAGVDLGAALTQAVQLVGPDNLAVLSLAGTTLAANKPRAFELGNIQEYPVIAADIIYEGAAVGENGSGYARPLVAGDPFLGFAESYVDNSAGAAGDKRVRVKRAGQVQLPVSGATAITANDGLAVYASDDDTFTTTSTSNTLIGKVSRWIESGVAVVDFKAGTVA